MHKLIPLAYLAPKLSMTAPGKLGSLRYSLSACLSKNRQQDHGESVIRDTLNFQPFIMTSRKRVVDAHALWKMTPLTQLRMALANLLADEASGSHLVHTYGLSQLSSTLNPLPSVDGAPGNEILTRRERS